MTIPERGDSMNHVKAAYENGRCPDCGEDIPEDVMHGQACSNCEHVFFDACARCGNVLQDNGLCSDEACPFSDHFQGCPAGWAGHPELGAGPCTCLAELVSGGVQ